MRTEVLEPRLALYSATLDLLPASDSGYSDSDNITNAPQWQVAVEGVTPGATVQLRFGDAVLAAGDASTESITLTIDAAQVAALADGEVSLYAIEVIDDIESDASATLVVIKDTFVDPFTSTAPTSAISGNALIYDAQNPEEAAPGSAYSLVGGPAGAAVDAQTGLVSWTPTDEQIGDFSFQILLTDAAGNSLAQDVNLTVHPAAVDSFALNAASDSGYSAGDRITNASTWTLDIGGVVDGAEVRIIYAGETIANGVASGSSIAIDVDATQFPEGSIALVAVQVVSGIASAPSAPVMVMRDATAPVGTTNNPPATLVPGQELNVDLEHAEEGTPGFTYALLGAPTGMAMDASTGALSWSPGAADAGSHSFSIVLTDAAGNQFLQSATISVSPVAPFAPVLAATSDSGVSDSDNLTSSDTWTISVAGVNDGATVRLLRDGEVVATETASGTSVTFTVDASTLADGQYVFTAEQVIDGLTSPASGSLTVVRDATAPADLANAAPLGLIVGTPLEFDFAHDEEGSAGFTYELVNPPSGAAIDPDTGLFTWTATADQIGARTLQIRLTDAAGNEHLQSIDVTVRPAAPQSPDLDDASDSGYSNSDNLTRETSWSVTIGGVIDGALVKLYHGDDVVASGVASGTSITLSVDASGFGDGTVELRAEQTVNDVPSPLSEALVIALDTTPPGDLTSPAAVSAVAGVPFTYDAEHAEEGTAGFIYALTSAPSGATIDAASGVISWSPTTADFGSNAFEILLTDAAGNTHTQTVVVAITPPAPATPDLEDASDSGFSNSDNLTRSTSWTIVVNEITDGATIRLWIDGAVAATSIASGTSVSFTIDASAFDDGQFLITADQSIDGNVSPLSSELAIILDTTAPSDATSDPIFFVAGSGGAADLNHVEEGTAGFTYALNNAPAGASIDPATGVITWSPGADQAGLQTLELLLTDAAGNQHTQSLTVTVRPAAPAAPDLDLASDSGYSNSDNLTNSATWTLLVSGVTIGATVHLRLGGESVATLTADDTSVTFTFDAGELADGEYVLTAEQIVSDITSPLSDPLTITLDTTPPGDLANAPPTTAIVDMPLVFDAQHAEEGSLGFSYALTSAPAGATIDTVTGEIHWTPTTAQYGANAFELLVTDGAGNAHAQSFSVLVTPPAPVAPDLAAGSDSGYRDDDNITNATSWTITIGGLTDGATVQLLLNGASIGSQTVSGDSATFTVDASAFADGDFVFTAVQTVSDVASPASAALTIVLDRMPPADLTSSLTAGAERGIEFVYDAQHPEEGTPGFTYALTTAPAGATMEPLTGEIHWTPTSEPYGVHEFAMLLTDAAGNTHTQTLSVTLTPPAPQAPDLADESDSGYSNSDNITNASSWNVTVNGLIVGATVRIYLDGALIDTFVADDTSHAFVMDASAFADGAHAVTADQTADDVTSPVSVALTIVKDTSPPANITNAPPTSAPIHQEFVFDAQHDEEGTPGFTYALTTAPPGATVDQLTGEIRWTPVSSQLGLNDFTLVLTDAAGNQTTQSFQVQVQPNAPQTPDLAAESDSGASSTDNITKATSWTVAVGDLFVGATVRLLIDGTVVATLTADANLVTFTVDATPLTEGSHSVTAVQEVDGIASPASAALPILKDTTAPGDLSNAPPTTAFIGQELVFDAQHAEEGEAGFTYSLVAGPAGATLGPLTGELHWTPTANQVGVNDIELQFTDAAGNTHNQTFSITIRPGAPSIPDLDTGSDSGVSNSDNVTSASNWTIVVGGVLEGATVELLRDGVVVDTLTASGTSVTFNVAASGLSEGAHIFTARQTFAGAASDLSATLMVTKDTTPPPDFTSTPPTSATVNQPLTYDAQNPEEGTSGFSYSLVNPPAGATIDPNTGVVTWTPSANQTGTQSFQIQVTDAAGNTRTQQITIAVQGEGPAAPTGIDLLDVSDSGFSQTDNLTNARTWQLVVTGVVSGATVNILRSGVVVGTATATGSSVLVLVRNTDAFPDGPVTLTAVQVVGGQTSTASPAIVIIKDTTPPESITSLPPDTIAAGQTLTYDAQHANEGQTGYVYSLFNAPAGVSIDATTGVMTWTPTTAQVGAYAFGIRLTDPAGNSTLQNVNLSVVTAQEQIVRFSIVVVDLQGNEITQVQRGDEFEIQVSARDARANPAGMFSAYLDLLYDPQLVQVSGNIQWGSSFPNAHSGSTTTPGLVDEVGGTGSLSGTPGDVLVFKLRFRAIGSGFVTFVTNPADDSVLHPVLVFNIGAAVPAEQVTQAAAGVTITSGTGAAPDIFVVQEDTQNNVLDVLDNDTLPASSTGTLTIASVTQPTTGGTVTIAQDGSHLLFTPTPNFFGSVSFTYTISDGQGFTDTATVQITVNNVNDNPTANNDTFSVNANADTTTLNVLANDAFAPDPQETLTITAVSAGSAGGTITIGASGANIQYKPAAGFVGAETFTYTITDGHGGTATATVTVNVTAVGGNPTAVNDTVTFGKNAGPQVINVLANDTAPSGQTLTITSVTQGSQGGLIEIINGGTAIRYTAAANFLGTETFTYTISNGQGGTSTATVTVNVQDFVASDISGFVYIDANNNGRKDSQEIGIGGVTITLTGTSTSGNSINLAAVSRADGSYTFQNVPPGTYTIVEAPLGFMIDGADALGSHGGTLLNDRFTVTFGQNSHLSGYNFGERGREARFVSMRDFLTSTPVENVMTAFNASGALTWYTLGKGWEGVSTLSATLNSSRTQVTLTMTDTNGAQFTATVSTSDRTRVQILGNESAGMLLRLVGGSNAFNFSPVVSAAVTQNANDNGGGSGSDDGASGEALLLSLPASIAAPMNLSSTAWSTAFGDSPSQGFVYPTPLTSYAVGAALALESNRSLAETFAAEEYNSLAAFIVSPIAPLPALTPPIEVSPITLVSGRSSKEPVDDSTEVESEELPGKGAKSAESQTTAETDISENRDEPTKDIAQAVSDLQQQEQVACAVEHCFAEWESEIIANPPPM